MFPSEQDPPSSDWAHEAPGNGLGVPSRDGLVSLSQASEVLGFRGQELWNMLRTAEITIHRVDWDDYRGSAITLRDLFRLRQSQVPPTTAARARGQIPRVPPNEPTRLGADVDRLRDLVSDAQLRNEYLSVELGNLRHQVQGRANEDEVSEAALHAVREQTAETIANLKSQVQASTRALDEAAEALEVERSRSRELERRVADMRSDLARLSQSRQLEELEETLLQTKDEAARAQADLERSLSLQRRTLDRLEREKSALADRLAVRDEIERNNQRYIDRLERKLEELRGHDKRKP